MTVYIQDRVISLKAFFFFFSDCVVAQMSCHLLWLISPSCNLRSAQVEPFDWCLEVTNIIMIIIKQKVTYKKKKIDLINEDMCYEIQRKRKA